MRLLFALVPLLAGCVSQYPEQEVELDEAFFRCRVQPVLTKYCATFACHGSGGRFFSILARNRLRFGIADESERNIPLTEFERALNFERALSMIDPADPAQSPLLLKPLEQESGGSFHVGAELYGGGDVFPDREGREFRTLQEWVNGATMDPECVEPGSQ